ncbi:MAG: MMPL family transporter [Planctomyces sp.]|nr:MMPL family transporter [Planctomyces sp.]
MSDAVAGAEREPPPTHSRLERVGGWLARRRVLLLLTAVVLTALAAVPASRLSLDESIESFFPPGDPLLEQYLASREAFGGDEFVLVAYPEQNPTHSDQLTSLQEFSDQLSAAPGVLAESTQDLARTLRVSTGPVLNLLPRIPARLARRTIRDRLIEFSRRLLIDDENSVSAIVLRLAPESESPVSRRQTLREIRRLADAHDPPAYVAGEPVQVNDMFRYVERDSRVLGLASTGLMVLAILLIFRRLRWVLLPLAIVHATLLWTKAVLYFADFKLSMVSSMLTSLLTIIGIATCTHIIVQYRELRLRLSREDAFRRVFGLAAGPIFWITVTTMMGFGALLTSEITPVRSFSWMMTIGTGLLLVAFPLILPAGVLSGPTRDEPSPGLIERRAEATLGRVSAWVDRHSAATLTLTLVAAAAAAIGCFLQRVETDFSKNFRSGSPIVKSIRFFESNLGGVGSWEVTFPAPQELTTEYVGEVRKLAQRLRELELEDGTRLTKVIALTDGLDLIPQIIAEDWIIKRDWLRRLQPEFEPSLYNPERKRMRILLRAYEQQPAEQKLALIAAVRRTAREIFPDADTTGLYVLLSNLITSILGDQLRSAWIAGLGILLSTFLAFRNWRIALLALMPNVLPILLVVGGIGWSGVPVNIGAAMVASVSLGLTVDASILYLTDYRRARRRGLPHAEAVRETQEGAGLAVILASLALMSGFAVLTLSEFIPLVYFGALVSVAMAVGLAGNLVLLPVLLKWIPKAAE